MVQRAERVVRLPANATLGRTRVRRTKEQSREQILKAAEMLLRRGGVEAVTVRAVGAAVGVTDAAVNHHFGTRDHLLAALLRHAGRRLKALVSSTIDGWQESSGVERLIGIIADLYADGLYATLALRLHLAGWRDRGSGLLDKVVDALHEVRVRAFVESERQPPPIAETRFIVGMMHQTLALDPLFGASFRRSAGLPATDEPSHQHKKQLWCCLIEAMLFADLRGSVVQTTLAGRKA